MRNLMEMKTEKRSNQKPICYFVQTQILAVGQGGRADAWNLIKMSQEMQIF